MQILRVAQNDRKATKLTLRYLTSGESHGPELLGIIDGLPSGLRLTEEAIARDLARRQKGYGRGGRMKIETDAARIVSGVRWGLTTGAPVGLVIPNRTGRTGKRRCRLFRLPYAGG